MATSTKKSTAKKSVAKKGTPKAKAKGTPKTKVAKAIAKVAKVPSGAALIIGVVEKVVAGDFPKANAKGEVIIRLHTSLNAKRTRAENPVKGEMKDTLNALWQNTQWKCNPSNPAQKSKPNPETLRLYPAYKALHRMPLENPSGKLAVFRATQEECEAMRDAVAAAEKKTSRRAKK